MPTNFEQNWKRLQESYHATIEGRVQQFFTLWRDGKQGKPELLQELLRHAHSMAGSGATYGLPELSVRAKAFELYLDQLLKSPRTIDDAVDDEVHAYIELTLRAARGESDLPEVGSFYPEVKSSNQGLVEMLGTRHIKILVAEDDVASRVQLVLQLESLGHRVIQAENGEEAVLLFAQERPDLVLMDIMMPKMNGYDAAARIKAMCGDSFLPIIFISAAKDERSLVEAIRAGGDDFLLKPYDRLVLQAKIFAMQRIENLNRQLAQYKIRTEEEVQLAHHVYNSITDRNDNNIDGISFWRESAGLFSGDIVFYTEGVDGLIYVFVGDFTGHGMAAALGGLVAADVFHALLEKGATPNEVIMELNRKLNNVLPTGRYCACALLAYDAESRYLSVWNCGLPEILVKDVHGVRRMASKNLPAGVMYSSSLFYEVEELELSDSASVVIYSDGITESVDRNGRLYGEERLLSLIEQSDAEGDALLRAIREDVNRHIADGGELLDDMTLFVMKR